MITVTFHFLALIAAFCFADCMIRTLADERRATQHRRVRALERLGGKR